MDDEDDNNGTICASNETPIETFQIYVEAKVLGQRIAALCAVLLHRHRRYGHSTRNFLQQRCIRITCQIMCQCANECIASPLEWTEISLVKVRTKVAPSSSISYRCIKHFFDFRWSHVDRSRFTGRSENRTIFAQCDDHSSTAQTQEIIYCTFRFSEINKWHSQFNRDHRQS